MLCSFIPIHCHLLATTAQTLRKEQWQKLKRDMQRTLKGLIPSVAIWSHLTTACSWRFQGANKFVRQLEQSDRPCRCLIVQRLKHGLQRRCATTQGARALRLSKQAIAETQRITNTLQRKTLGQGIFPCPLSWRV